MLRSIANRPSSGLVAVAMRPAFSRSKTLLKVVAFKESDGAHQDWRVTSMATVSHHYYCTVWSTGDPDAVDEIIDDNIVYKDVLWGPKDLIVGKEKFKKVLREARESYPDLYFLVDEVGTSDSNHIFIKWTASGTNLHPRKGNKPTRHESHITGIDLIGFDPTRSRIVEVTSYRQPTAEEREDAVAAALAASASPFEIKLARLHW